MRYWRRLRLHPRVLHDLLRRLASRAIAWFDTVAQALSLGDLFDDVSADRDCAHRHFGSCSWEPHFKDIDAKLRPNSRVTFIMLAKHAVYFDSRRLAVPSSWMTIVCLSLPISKDLLPTTSFRPPSEISTWY